MNQRMNLNVRKTSSNIPLKYFWSQCFLFNFNASNEIDMRFCHLDRYKWQHSCVKMSTLSKTNFFMKLVGPSVCACEKITNQLIACFLNFTRFFSSLLLYIGRCVCGPVSFCEKVDILLQKNDGKFIYLRQYFQFEDLLVPQNILYGDIQARAFIVNSASLSKANLFLLLS